MDRASSNPGVALALLGPPGPLMTWAITQARSIAAHFGLLPLREGIYDGEEATREFLAAPTLENALIIAHYPHPDLFAYLSRQQVPVLLVADRPLACVLHDIRQSGRGAIEAARPITQSLSLLAPARSLPQTVVLGSADHALPAARAIYLIARLLLGAAPDLAALRQMPGLEEWGKLSLAEAADRLVLDGQPLAALEGTLEEKERQGIGMVCDGLLLALEAGLASEVTWPVDFFFDGKTFTSPAPLVLDMTGPARCLFYGPYLHLPVGFWHADVYFGLTKDVVETHLRIEVYSDKLDAAFMTIARAGGLYRFPLEFEIADPRQPLQIRIFIDRGEISGKLGLAHVKLRPAQRGLT